MQKVTVTPNRTTNRMRGAAVIAGMIKSLHNISYQTQQVRGLEEGFSLTQTDGGIY